MLKILVIDDEKPILELIRYNLEKEGYRVLVAIDGKQGFELAQNNRPDLIVLDVMLPEQDGLEVCRLLRHNQATREIPVIMLSARGEELDKVLGLEMGADDYVTKPFSPRELLARIKVQLRRNRFELTEGRQVRQEERQIVFGKMVIDRERFAVTVDGLRQDLTPKEFELLWFLAQQPGRVFSRDCVLEKVWGYDFPGDSRTVDVHIRHIRQKLEKIPGTPQFIETVRGIGYRFKETC